MAELVFTHQQIHFFAVDQGITLGRTELVLIDYTIAHALIVEPTLNV